jgi:hypothetical protein
MHRLISSLLIAAGICLGVASTAAAGTDDTAIAEDVVLTQADVAEYGLQESAPNDDTVPAGKECKKVRAVVKAAERLPNAVTRFTDQPMIVEDRVVLYKNPKAAKTALAAYASRQGATCVQTDLDETLDVVLKAGTKYRFDGLSPTSTGLGDDSALYQVEVDLSDSDGNTGKVYSEYGLIRVGRGLATMQVLRFGNPFDGSVDLATLLADRLETAVA